jgi:signal transduction histidine kinase
MNEKGKPMGAEDNTRQGLHIVVAEDSATQAELMNEVLINDGFGVTLTRNGIEALEAARALRPALIVTDVVMPDMDGYQLCRAVKADATLRDIPVMIVTSLREIDDIVMALESGADNFIRKPFDPKALLARIDFLLANRKLRSHSKLQFGIEISLGGRKHLITAEREQILDLLFSSYEEALQANEELRLQQEEVQSLNLKLAARAVELEDANAQLRSFSHTVSHDLRSPLATINMFATVLQESHGSELDAKARRFLMGIENEAQRMIRIVEDVLYLANIDNSQVQRTDVDLASIAGEVIQSLRANDPQRSVRFESDAAAHASCDERLLRIAVGNLVGNAWKFTRKRADAHIRFSVESDGAQPVFCVADNGAGFDMRHHNRLFKAFERLHRNDEFEGFGIGLATVQRIVALHGGRIWAEAAPEQGATFRFTLGPR